MGIFDGGSLFDGSGSFGLGLGGFDISDFMGFTDSFGTIDMGDTKFGAGVNDFNTGQQDYLGSFENDFTNFDSTKFTGLGNISDGGGLSTLIGGNTASSLTPASGANNTSGSGNSTMDWVLGAANLANSLYKDKDARDYRDDVYNNQVKTQNDSLEGKKQLVNTYYGVSAGDSAEEAAAKSNNNPTLTRDSYSTR